MNDVQNVILDLLKEFISVAQSLNLKWYMVNGSALGAVKYSGFIAWDDDVDVAMPREDYEVFCDKANQLLKKSTFLQNYRTDKNFPHTYSKLRNSDTACIENGVAHLKMNHGIYIDIFPLDEYPCDDSEIDKFIKKLKMLRWKQYCALNDKSKTKIYLRNLAFRALGYHKKTAQTIGEIEHLITGFDKSGEYWCNHGDRMGKKGCIKKSVYGDGKLVSFEGIDVIIPENFDEYLTLKYGDWRKEPEPDEQVSHHKHIVIDAHKSYLLYSKSE